MRGAFNNIKETTTMRKPLEEKYHPIVAQTPFVLKSITQINHKPHPYTIGPKHIHCASEHHGGMLRENTCKAVPCAHEGCKVPYDQHTHDAVMMLSLTRNLAKEEASAALQQIVDAGTDADGIDGFVFVDTEEKFRIK
jgi:hypothetical protein